MFHVHREVCISVTGKSSNAGKGVSGKRKFKKAKKKKQQQQQQQPGQKKSPTLLSSRWFISLYVSLMIYDRLYCNVLREKNDLTYD